MNKDLTVIIPALNEEKNITAAIESVKGALDGFVEALEIIVIDDGSTDATSALAEAQARNDPRIRVIPNGKNLGYGYSYRRGIELASRSYVTVFPGDHDMSAGALRDLMQKIGEADFVTAYPVDISRRSLGRRILSVCFVSLLNVLFRLRLKYYNGPFICRRALLQSILIKSNGLSVLAECKIRLLKRGCTYKEICFAHTGRRHGRSKAFRLQSLAQVFKSIVVLFKDIYFTAESKTV